MNKVFPIFLSLFCVVFCVKNSKRIEEVEKLIKTCAKNSKGTFNLEDLKGHYYQAGSYKDKTGKLLEPSKDIKCALKCILQKSGVMDESNKYNEAYVSAEKFPREVKDFMKVCVSKVSGTSCDLAYGIKKCNNKGYFEWRKNKLRIIL